MPQLADPDHHTEIYEELMAPCALIGRFDEALRLVEAHAELSRRLTPHHRIHSIAMELEVKELIGDWAVVRERTPVVERLVTENLGTPCIRNARSLLVEAVAHAYGGGHEAARRLEERALEIAFEGFGYRLFGPRVRLALLRDELDVVEQMIDAGRPAARPRLDGHRRDGLDPTRRPARARPASRTWSERLRRSSRSSSVLRPFALRALGVGAARTMRCCRTRSRASRASASASMPRRRG